MSVLVGVVARGSNRGECDVVGGLVVAVWAEEAAESEVWFEVEVSVEFAEFVRLMEVEAGMVWWSSSGERRTSTAEAITPEPLSACVMSILLS